MIEGIFFEHLEFMLIPNSITNKKFVVYKS